MPDNEVKVVIERLYLDTWLHSGAYFRIAERMKIPGFMNLAQQGERNSLDGCLLYTSGRVPLLETLLHLVDRSSWGLPQNSGKIVR